MKTTESTKKTWADPEIKKFNKMDLVKGGPSGGDTEGCYKVGS